MSTTSRTDFWINSFLPFAAAMAASGTLIPLFIISSTIGGSVSDIGYLSALGSLVSLPMAFIWGKLTDDTGKRKVFIFIMFLSGLGILLGYSFESMFASTYEINIVWITIISITSGLLLGAGDTAKNMYIFDKYPPDLWEEKISKYQQRSGIGACAGLIFGGLFQMYFGNYMIFFLICAILSGVSAVMAFLTIKEITTDKSKEYKVARTPIVNEALPIYSSLVQSRRILSYKMEPQDQKDPTKSQITATLLLFFGGAFSLFLASNLTFTPLAAYISQTPPLGLGISESFVFWIFLGYYAVSVIGYTFAGNWIDKQGNRKIFYMGLIMRVAVYVVFAIFTFFILDVTSAFIVIIVLLVFAGLSYSLMNVALQNTLPRLIKKNVGEILALYSIIVGVSAILGSFFSGLIAENMGYLWLFLFSVIFAALAGVIYWKAIKKDIK